MSKLGDVVSKLVQIKRVADQGLGAESQPAEDYKDLGAKSPAAGRSFVMLWKK